MVQTTFPLIFFLQLRGPATALSRKFLHDLTTARHFDNIFCNMDNKNIYNENRDSPAARQ
jgi:hypothetical protein